MTAKAVDPAFRGLGKANTCFIIWKVENMQLTPVPKEEYGKFYNGDSYLIYSAFESGQPCGMNIKPKECKGPLERYIHFWLGSTTTQDEAGVAAIKSVELDDFLGGSPVQQREVEGSESPRFLSYFKDGFRILSGGVASGFRKVTDDFKPALYSVKGKRTPITRQLPSVSWSEMNEGDVFVLDNKTHIFLWSGKHSNNHEKLHGAKLAQSLKSDHGEVSCTIVVVDDGQEMALPPNERKVFEELLPIKDKKVKTAEEAGTDETQEKKVATEIKLYQCSDDGGTLKVTEVKKGPLFQSDLNSTDSFIIDNGEQGIFVWVGKKATQQERAEAMRNAQGFAKKKGYPSTTPVVRVIDGGEPPEFKSLFRGWKDRDQAVGFGRQASTSKIAKTVQTKFDATTLHSQPKLAAESGMFDDGSGTKEVYRIIDFDLSPVPSSEHGKFYGGDCYVINYAYKSGGAEKNVIYYWLGSTAGQDEKGTAALKAVELDTKLGGRAVQVRVVQGKEPKHFLAIFNGKMIIFSGGHASAFESQQGEKDEHLGNTYLLQVRGNSGNNTKAIQVPTKASSLNSNDVFVLMSPAAVYVWCGKGSTGDEREMAKQIATQGRGDPLIISEGQEKSDFWDLLGGKGQYFTDKRTAEEYETHAPRLFQCSNATGNFKAEEILDFAQSDLVEDDVMVLDAWESVFIWAGVNSNKDEIAKSEALTVEYLKSDPKGRDPDTPIIKIRQGHEPPTFTGFFGTWDPECWENKMTFDKFKDQLKADDPTVTLALSSYTVNGNGGGIKYALQVLQEKDPDKLPKGVDPCCKETFLTDEDFEKCFKMEREAFANLPGWKKQQLKKSVGIF